MRRAASDGTAGLVPLTPLGALAREVGSRNVGTMTRLTHPTVVGRSVLRSSPTSSTRWIRSLAVLRATGWRPPRAVWTGLRSGARGLFPSVKSGRSSRRPFSSTAAASNPPGVATPPELPVRPPRVAVQHTPDTVAVVFRRKTYYMLLTGIAVFAFLNMTDFTSWVYHFLHKDELEAHWAGRLYDESYQLLLKRSKQPLLAKHQFLATLAEREALARGDFQVNRISGRHSFLTWRYDVAKDGSIKHTFKFWKFDVEIDVSYPLLVGRQYVGDLRARGILGMEDMHLLLAEVVPRTGQIPIQLTKREKQPAFAMGFTAYPPHVIIPDKWRPNH